MGAAALSRLISSLLFGVSPTDLKTFGLAAILLFTLTIVACLIPARRAVQLIQCWPVNMNSTMECPRILIADDQPHILEALRLLLKSEGFVPETASSPKAVMQAIHDGNFDVLLLDMNYARDTTSGTEGLEFAFAHSRVDSSMPVILMTAWANIELAVEAMQNGGGDFIQKPWDNDKLLSALRRQIEEGRILREKKREIEEAREIQERLLPVDLSKISGCDVHVFWKPAKEVGGDYFDAIPLTGTKTAFCIGDVAGKGLPAALLMSNMQASVRGLAESLPGPAEMCRS